MNKSSRDATPQQTSVQTAWGCLTTNLAVPGFGSLLAGRRVSGILQFLAAIGALALQAIFGVRFVLWYIENRTRLGDPYLDDPTAALGELWVAVRWVVVGFLAFGIAWLWALLTSLSILREAKRATAPPKPPRL